MKVGFTGHQSREGIDWNWVSTELEDHLAALPPPTTGYSSLAAGADQIFAQKVLDLGGALEVVVPFAEYAATFETSADRARYDSLLKSARVTNLPGATTDEESYLEAGRRIVDACDIVFAVWDGKRASGLGGTGHIVAYALKAKKPVVHMNTSTKTATTLGRE